MISLFSLMALQGKLEGLLVPETEVVFMPTLINGGIIYMYLYFAFKNIHIFLKYRIKLHQLQPIPNTENNNKNIQNISLFITYSSSSAHIQNRSTLSPVYHDDVS